MTAMPQAMQVLTSRATVEWYTPQWITDRARAQMGGIDLDPATAPHPQTWIGASRYYCLQVPAGALPASATDRERAAILRKLSRQQLAAQPSWAGRVWLNPPFDDTPLWIRRMDTDYEAGHVREALLLVNSAPGYTWWERLWRRRPVVLLRDRVQFVRGDGGPAGAAKRGTTIAYYGPNCEAFARSWADVGRVIMP